MIPKELKQEYSRLMRMTCGHYCKKQYWELNASRNGFRDKAGGGIVFIGG